MKEILDISELNINDSVLLSTKILVDSLEMELDYITDYNAPKSKIMKLVFSECSKIEFLINPGYNTPNTLYAAKESESSSHRIIHIETCTTAGVIIIECKSVHFGE